MAAKKKASVKGEKRFRGKRPRPIKIHVVKELPAMAPPDPVVPIETQDPPPLRDRGRDHLWKVSE